MTLPGSGQISMSDINTEFGLGYNLNAYQGQPYICAVSPYTSGTFPSGQISFSNFYNTAKSYYASASVSFNSYYTQVYGNPAPLNIPLGPFSCGQIALHTGPGLNYDYVIIQLPGGSTSQPAASCRVNINYGVYDKTFTTGTYNPNYSGFFVPGFEYTLYTGGVGAPFGAGTFNVQIWLSN
jgi:hypothetical protein